MAKILLNWLPPSMESMPSPAHSVLKQTLERQDTMLILNIGILNYVPY